MNKTDDPIGLTGREGFNYTAIIEHLKVRWGMLILDFMERNQVTALYTMSMAVVGFALYVALRIATGK